MAGNRLKLPLPILARILGSQLYHDVLRLDAKVAATA